MRQQRGFTLIELLVVIAIIGILATLVITQIAGATTKARNSNAQSDVTEAGKGIQLFINDQSNPSGNVITTAAAAKSFSQATAGTPLATMTYFNGTQSFTTGALEYGTSLTKTPSTAYTYTYTAGATGETAGTMSSVPTYCFSTNILAAGSASAGFFGQNNAGNTSASC